jgi:hypothetical protein
MTMRLPRQQKRIACRSVYYASLEEPHTLAASTKQRQVHRSRISASNAVARDLSAGILTSAFIRRLGPLSLYILGHRAGKRNQTVVNCEYMTVVRHNEREV